MHGALSYNTVWCHTYKLALYRLKATECSLSLSHGQHLSLSHSVCACVCVCDHGRYAYSSYIWGWGDLLSCVFQPELSISTKTKRRAESHAYAHTAHAKGTHTFHIQNTCICTPKDGVDPTCGLAEPGSYVGRKFLSKL